MGDANQDKDLALIRRIRQGDRQATEELVQKYLPMVKHIARRHYAAFLDFDDLLQEGLIGLLNAIEEYKPEEYAIKFSSFAYLCIIRKIYNIIKQANGAKHRALNEAVSLHSFVGTDDHRTMFDLLPLGVDQDPGEVVENKLIAQHIQRILANHLSLLEYAVAALLLQGYSCAEIERRIGVGAKAVDNARTRVKLKLRRILRQYGSLLHPKVPTKVRRRQDLYAPVRFGS